MIEFDPIFASPCDHDDCASVVFHGLCLMSWREHREECVNQVRRWVENHRGTND